MTKDKSALNVDAVLPITIESTAAMMFNNTLGKFVTLCTRVLLVYKHINTNITKTSEEDQT
jgi:hypothetical protein